MTARPASPALHGDHTHDQSPTDPGCNLSRQTAPMIVRRANRCAIAIGTVVLCASGCSGAGSQGSTAPHEGGHTGHSASGVVMYGGTRTGGRAGVWASGADGVGVHRVVAGWTECCFFAVSADGARILIPEDTADGRITTATINSDGTGHTALPLPGRSLNLGPGAWSPDGSRIAFEGWDETNPGRNGIYTADSHDGGDLRRLTSTQQGSHDLPLTYSPDGTWILLYRTAADVNTDNPRCTSCDLYAVRANGMSPHRLNPPGTSVITAFSNPTSWSPTGTRVAFTAYGPTPGDDARSAVFTIDPAAHHARRITTWNDWTTSVSWSPNGNWLAFDTRSPSGAAANDLYISHPNGTDLTDILASPPNQGACCAIFSPDSTHVLFQQGDGTLWTTDIRGRHRHEIVRAEGEYQYSWLP